MNYEFGDIFDCRESSLKHFVLILGTNRKDEVMYYIITSRTYKVFKNIIEFFNDCIDSKYNRFFKFFGKEKDTKKIIPTGNLCDAFFLDKQENYSGCLEVDSMVLINSEPELMDKSVLDGLYKSKQAKCRSRLENNDNEKFIKFVRLSKNISPYNKSEIGRNFNLWKRSSPVKK